MQFIQGDTSGFGEPDMSACILFLSNDSVETHLAVVHRVGHGSLERASGQDLEGGEDFARRVDRTPSCPLWHQLGPDLLEQLLD